MRAMLGNIIKCGNVFCTFCVCITHNKRTQLFCLNFCIINCLIFYCRHLQLFCYCNHFSLSLSTVTKLWKLKKGKSHHRKDLKAQRKKQLGQCALNDFFSVHCGESKCSVFSLTTLNRRRVKLAQAQIYCSYGFDVQSILQLI